MEERIIEETLQFRPDLVTEYNKLKSSVEKSGVRIVEDKTQEEFENLIGRRLSGKALGHYEPESDTIFLFGSLGKHPLILFEELYHRYQAGRYPSKFFFRPCSETEIDAFRCLLELEVTEEVEKYAQRLNCLCYLKEIIAKKREYIRRLEALPLDQEVYQRVLEVFFSYV